MTGCASPPWKRKSKRWRSMTRPLRQRNVRAASSVVSVSTKWLLSWSSSPNKTHTTHVAYVSITSVAYDGDRERHKFADGGEMSRATTMLELLIRLDANSRFSVDELAGEFGVSRRTMLRDLQALSEMGVPLASRTGPGGGYSLIRDRRLLPLSLTVDEALGMLISYEGFLRYAQSPFSEQNLSAVTRLRAALPAETVQELDRLRRHVAIISRPPRTGTPFLPDLLQAALDGVHLRIDYDGRSGRSTRMIFPYGLFASDGYWYCACHDDKRNRNLSLRVDRILAMEPVEGLDRPE